MRMEMTTEEEKKADFDQFMIVIPDITAAMVEAHIQLMKESVDFLGLARWKKEAVIFTFLTNLAAYAVGPQGEKNIENFITVFKHACKPYIKK